MIIIADSGSTKTDWRIINGVSDIEQIEGIGLNPNFHSINSISAAVKSTFSKFEKAKNAQVVYFYGAGCSTESQKGIVKTALYSFFHNANIHVEHDLLGAARAACYKNEGIAAILGTGSNVCSFDGENIIQSFPSGGYAIGDEGGGVNIGRRVLKAYIEEYMPKELRDRFDFRYKLNIDDILHQLYEKEQPNRFMASFSHFAYQHKENAFMASQIMEEFQQFFDNKVLRFDKATDWPLNTVGSVGFYYHEFLTATAEANDVKVGAIIEKPIAALSLYHSDLGQ